MSTKGSDLELIASILSENPLIHRPEILFGKLSDGLDYCIFNSESQRNCFHLSIVLNTGSIHEGELEKGIANFIQQLILTELNKELLKIRTGHLTNVTSSTDFHCTIFNIYNEIEDTQLSDSELRATFFDVLEIFLHTVYKFREKLISSPNSLTNDVETIKSKVFDAIEQSNCSVANYIEKQFFSQFHTNTLLPKRWPIGERSTIENLTIPSLLRFVSKWYVPNNMCLFFAGDIPASNELLVTNLAGVIAGINRSDSEDTASCLKNAYETSDSNNIFSAGERIGYKTIQNTINIADEIPEHDFCKELVVQHPNINHISISIGVKLEICPLVDEGEIFMNAIDTIISNIIHTKLLYAISQLKCDEATSVSWDFYNSSRENCGWNTFSIVTMEDCWRPVFRLVIEQIIYICNTIIPRDEFEEVVLTTISDYKKAAEDEISDDPKLVLDGLIDDWLCGSTPLSKKQEYQLFCKVVDRINPEIVQYRCKRLFEHILNYFENKNGLERLSSGCIFVSKPMSRHCEGSFIEQENSVNISNGARDAKEVEQEFLKSLMAEYRDCICSRYKPLYSKSNNTSPAISHFDESCKIERMSENAEFGIWDTLKASTYISLEKIIGTIKSNMGIFNGEIMDLREYVEGLNGKYSIKELDLLAERIKTSSNRPSNNHEEWVCDDLSYDICDLGP
ncbi:peptidase'insulinase-like peptidase' [Cryptosporidium canis]|uniref:Peptidase'insulinase-like peptidase n=1 Tax=Cryptosporidium canis TaxID=195482 RepID=A0A9D5HUY7_9CRYT|nr:peptidase'insulinase-like peptidase' [Cryptosporidium canis]